MPPVLFKKRPFWNIGQWYIVRERGRECTRGLLKHDSEVLSNDYRTYVRGWGSFNVLCLYWILICSISAVLFFILIYALFELLIDMAFKITWNLILFQRKFIIKYKQWNIIPLIVFDSQLWGSHLLCPCDPSDKWNFIAETNIPEAYIYEPHPNFKGFAS